MYFSDRSGGTKPGTRLHENCVRTERGAHVPAASRRNTAGAVPPQACRQARSAPPPGVYAVFRFAASQVSNRRKRHCSNTKEDL